MRTRRQERERLISLAAQGPWYERMWVPLLRLVHAHARRSDERWEREHSLGTVASATAASADRMRLGWVQRLCPDCRRPIRFAGTLEVVRCPWCGSGFHPEHSLPDPRARAQSE